MNNRLFSISHLCLGAKVGFLLLFIFLFNSQAAYATDPVTCRVIKVFDGDTILVLIVDRKEKVRLLGIDSPERDGPYTKLEPFGNEAQKRLEGLTIGQRVTLHFGGARLRDRYGRLLAHVMLPGGRSANEIMLKEGYARVFRKFKYTRKKKYRELAAEAKKACLGLWSLEPSCAKPLGKNSQP